MRANFANTAVSSPAVRHGLRVWVRPAPVASADHRIAGRLGWPRGHGHAQGIAGAAREANMAGPLDGIVVLDLTRALAGPHATMLLGDLGARVIKLERPGTGDESRHWGPPFAAAADGEAAEPESTYFLSCNRNKESVTCDLRSDEGRELLTRLVRRGDVLAEN